MRPIQRTALLFILLFFTSCARPPSLSPLPEGAVVLAFGDSITYGMGAGKGEDYPALLEQLISRRVIRSGIPGEVTAGGLLRLGSDLDRHRPALLILCEGGNDFIRKLGDGQAAENLRAMVRLAKERGIDVVLVGVPKLGISLTVPDLYADIATEFGIPYEGKVLKKVLSDGSFKADYIHPNRKGYRVMADALANLLRERGAIK